MERTSRRLGLSVVKAGVLLPIVQHARESGVRIDALLRRAHLPANFGEDPQAIVPSASWHTLYDQLTRETGVSDIGWQVGFSSRLSAFSREFTQGMASAASLLEAIRFASRFGRRHCSSHDVSIRVRGDYGYVIHSNGGDHFPGASQRSLARTASVVLVIREFLGDSWQPDLIAVNAAQSELPNDGSFEETRIICRPGCDIVRVPRTALSARCLRPIVTNRDLGDSIPNATVDRLEQLLSTCVIEDWPSVLEMAEMLGISSRSLQRKFTDANTSYTEIKQRVRYNKAAAMLRYENARIIDVANNLGYEDPSHFTRFFRRVAGISPSHFRTLHQHSELAH
jgi:AraC-like DNA-binding protein